METCEVVDGKVVEEDLEFADYDSIEDCCRDYAWLITQGAPYRAAWQRYLQDRDLHALAAAVAATYASDPQYATMVSLIAVQTNVTRDIAGARQESANA